MRNKDEIRTAYSFFPTKNNQSIKKRKNLNTSLNDLTFLDYSKRTKVFGIPMIADFLPEDRERYLDNQERKKYLLQIKNNKFIDSNGFDCKGKYIAIIGSDNQIYAVKPNEITKNHSHLSGGDRVKFSGQLTFINGSLLEISNNSGHYKPMLHEVIEIIDNVILVKLTSDETVYFTDYSQPVPLTFNCDDLLENMEEILEQGHIQDLMLFEKSVYLTKVYRPPLEILSSLSKDNLAQQNSAIDTSLSNEEGYSDLEDESNEEELSKLPSTRFYSTLKKKKSDTKEQFSTNLELI
ncbi:MAG: hypothetical protein HYX60_00455 [Legionella longbeachae]|nr:hypothetical protein [Legionella longbeachae]